jgi:uncharacterized protein YndB with AHSA1/START domain
MRHSELEPIQIGVTIPGPADRIFKALVQQQPLETWMCDDALVEPRVGGRFELTFSSGTIPFTSRGRITRIEPGRELAFTFQGPTHLQGGIAAPEDRAQVYLRLRESPEGVEVMCEQGGWIDSEAGEEAKAWHRRHWEERLDSLRAYLTEEAER